MTLKTAVTVVALNNAKTRRSLSSSNGEPQNRRISSATRRAPPALATAKTVVLARLRSPSRLAAKVATITPMTTGHRTVEPNATRKPEATPAAGQNTATPSALPSKARLTRAARKKTMATEIEMAHGGRAREECAGDASRVATSALILLTRFAHAIWLGSSRSLTAVQHRPGQYQEFHV